MEVNEKKGHDSGRGREGDARFLLGDTRGTDGGDDE